ncbi:hypothetical protein CDD82_5670 [Ophiocordyceps australis]|uniref:MOSC domain-containing protein n=1 Tax=Ophiocordyceps australis TaxID=1399860 RepID=A0A2C5XHY9_9HYPO|nr:hypothetical protein CDD82_5670 [Ophiocordyceps australis]
MGNLLTQVDPGPVFLVAVTLIVFAIPVFILFPPIPVEHSDALRQTHSKIGLPLLRSNLRSQHRSNSHAPLPGRPASIQSLFVYPIKSCRGLELAQATVLPNGLEHDRLFAFAQLKPSNNPDHAWEVLTQRAVPLMANIKVDVWLPDASKASRQLGKPDDHGFVVVRFPHADSGLHGLLQSLAAKLSRGLTAVPEKSFILPLDFPSKAQIAARGFEYASVKIWSSSPSALNMEPDLPPQLARYLGINNRLGLFRMHPHHTRQVLVCAPHEYHVGYQPSINFQDAHPLHLLSITSVHHLQSKIQTDKSLQHLDVRRFRANIILSGAEAYDEDDWKLVQFGFKDHGGKNMFHVACRTTRCKLPNVDQATGTRHGSEPDRALRKFRNIDDGAPKMGCLGMQLCPIFAQDQQQSPDRAQAFLQVGMEVNVLQRGPHHFGGKT